MKGEPLPPEVQVKEYAGATVLIGIVILAGLGIALIWGLDPRWLYTAAVAFVLAFVLAAANDARRKANALRAAQEALREALDGPFDQAVHDFSAPYPSPADWERIRGEYPK